MGWLCFSVPLDKWDGGWLLVFVALLQHAFHLRSEFQKVWIGATIAAFFRA